MTKGDRLLAEVSITDDFQCHGAAQIDVERLVCDAHRTATQFDWLPLFAHHQLVMIKPLGWPSRYWLERILSNRGLAGLNPVSESLPKHADRAEFHCSREFIATTRTSALGLRSHGLNRPSDATKASQSAWISSSISAGSDTVRPTSARNSAVYRFRNRWISVLTAPVPT